MCKSKCVCSRPPQSLGIGKGARFTRLSTIVLERVIKACVVWWPSQYNVCTLLAPMSRSALLAVHNNTRRRNKKDAAKGLSIPSIYLPVWLSGCRVARRERGKEGVSVEEVAMLWMCEGDGMVT